MQTTFSTLNDTNNKCNIPHSFPCILTNKQKKRWELKRRTHKNESALQMQQTPGMILPEIILGKKKKKRKKTWMCHTVMILFLNHFSPNLKYICSRCSNANLLRIALTCGYFILEKISDTEKMQFRTSAVYLKNMNQTSYQLASFLPYILVCHF